MISSSRFVASQPSFFVDVVIHISFLPKARGYSGVFSDKASAPSFEAPLLPEHFNLLSAPTKNRPRRAHRVPSSVKLVPLEEDPVTLEGIAVKVGDISARFEKLTEDQIVGGKGDALLSGMKELQTQLQEVSEINPDGAGPVVERYNALTEAIPQRINKVQAQRNPDSPRVSLFFAFCLACFHLSP